MVRQQETFYGHHNYVLNIENELKYENQGFMKNKSYFVQHITIAHHT